MNVTPVTPVSLLDTQATVATTHAPTEIFRVAKGQPAEDETGSAMIALIEAVITPPPESAPSLNEVA